MLGALRAYNQGMARTLALTIILFGLTAPAAMAQSAHDGGHGLIGETNDMMVTMAGFILLAFFPLFILVMSIIQWRLEKRKDERLAAAKARRARVYERQGY